MTLTPIKRHACPENLLDVTRLIEVATRYPDLEVSALAERFGAPDRSVRRVLEKAGLARTNPHHEANASIRLTVHPWRPAPRRRPAAIAMSREERQRLIDDFLAKNSVTRVPCGQMATSDVTDLDTIHE